MVARYQFQFLLLLSIATNKAKRSVCTHAATSVLDTKNVPQEYYSLHMLHECAWQCRALFNADLLNLVKKPNTDELHNMKK